MKFNDAEWRRRSAERLKAQHTDPVFKARVRRGVAAGHTAPRLQQRRGNLTSAERAAILAAVNAGGDRWQIAEDWLISKGRLDHIVSEERRGVNSRGKDKLGTAILYIVGAAGYDGITDAGIVAELKKRFGYGDSP